jgi:hypothetical protein
MRVGEVSYVEGTMSDVWLLSDHSEGGKDRTPWVFADRKLGGEYATRFLGQSGLPWTEVVKADVTEFVDDAGAALLSLRRAEVIDRGSTCAAGERRRSP